MPEPLMNGTLGNRVVRAIAKKAHPEFGDDCYFCNVAMAPLAEAVNALVEINTHAANADVRDLTKNVLTKLKEIADGK